MHCVRSSIFLKTTNPRRASRQHGLLFPRMRQRPLRKKLEPSSLSVLEFGGGCNSTFLLFSVQVQEQKRMTACGRLVIHHSIIIVRSAGQVVELLWYDHHTVW